MSHLYNQGQHRPDKKRGGCHVDIDNHNGGKIFFNCGGKFPCNVDEELEIRYNLTFHEYLLLEYDRRVDHLRINDNVLKNRDKWTINGVVDEVLLAQFYVSNIDLFSDTPLFHQVLSEARTIYDTDIGNPLWSPFDKVVLDEFIDISGQTSGLNFLKFNRQALLLDYQKYCTNVPNSNYTSLNEVEKNHFNSCFDLFLKSITLLDYIVYLERTINNDKFSPFYTAALAFELNVARFYASGDIDTPIINKDTETIYDTKIYGIGSNGFYIGYKHVYASVIIKSCGEVVNLLK